MSRVSGGWRNQGSLSEVQWQGARHMRILGAGAGEGVYSRQREQQIHHQDYSNLSKK